MLPRPVRDGASARPSLAIAWLIAACVPAMAGLIGPAIAAANHVQSHPVQRAGKTPTPHVGSAMAVLATLEQARVLPPEDSKEANEIIKSVIQFQSVYSKSTDPAVQEFLLRALASREPASETMAQFRREGWTASVLEALEEAEARAPANELQSLGTGFGQFNVSVDEFRRFMRLVRDARSALASRGMDFEQVYASRRKEMPGAGVR